MHHALTRAVAYIRLPGSAEETPEILPDFKGLRCPVTGRTYTYANGILHLLDGPPDLTPAQKSLSSPVTAWFYDRFRGLLGRRFGIPPFQQEVEQVQSDLDVQAGDVVFDLACGHGNFTMEWAKRAGPTGLVIGLDISAAMLQRASNRVRKAGATNVLLVRGDALSLPLASRSIMKLNCSGGFHQMPNLPRVLSELARVAGTSARFTTATFARVPNDPNEDKKRAYERRYSDTLRFIPMNELEDLVASSGFGNCHSRIPGGWFGYLSATRNA